MRPVTTTVVGAVNGATIPLDYLVVPFQVSVGCWVVSGSVNFKLQYTYDDPDSVTTWFDHPLMTGKTAAFDAVINAGPVMAIRIVNAGTGTVGVRVIQGGP